MEFTPNTDILEKGILESDILEKAILKIDILEKDTLKTKQWIVFSEKLLAFKM